MFSQQIQGWGASISKRAQSTRLNPCQSRRAQVVFKQLWFEKIKAVEWKEKIDDAAESCRQYHTALFRTPGRRHLGWTGSDSLI